MIQVVYTPAQFRVTVRGHAHSGEPGRELVCAAVSALAVALSENVKQLRRLGLLRELRLQLRPGLAEIRCVPRMGARGVTRVILGAFCMGWAKLAREYPEYVAFQNGGGKAE